MRRSKNGRWGIGCACRQTQHVASHAAPPSRGLGANVRVTGAGPNVSLMTPQGDHWLGGSCQKGKRGGEQVTPRHREEHPQSKPHIIAHAHTNTQ